MATIPNLLTLEASCLIAGLALLCSCAKEIEGTNASATEAHDQTRAAGPASPLKEKSSREIAPPFLSNLVNGTDRVQAFWSDYDDQQQSATVLLPKSYWNVAVQFRSRQPGESGFSYLRSAFEALKTVDHLRIPNGSYEIHETDVVGGLAFRINNLQDKTIDFSNSTVSFNSPLGFLYIVNSKRIAVRNLRLVHKYPLASLGRVDVIAGRRVIRLAEPHRQSLANRSPDFSRISAIYQARQDIFSKPNGDYIWRKNNSTFRLIDESALQNGIEFYDQPTGIYQIRPQDPLNEKIPLLGDKGSPVIIKHHSYTANGISTNSSDDLTFEGIVIHGVPGMAFYLSGINSGLLVRNCVIKANKQENPLSLFGATVDGIHVHRLGRNAIIVENEIADVGDDGINVYHGQFLRVTDSTGTKLTVMRPGGGGPFTILPGAILRLYAGNLDLLDDGLVVQAIEGPAQIGQNGVTKLILNRLPSGLPPSMAAFVSLDEKTSSGVFIANNTVRNSTARGMLIQARLAMIKGNRIEHVARNAIKVTSDSLWFFESGMPENVKIIQNTIRNAAWDHLDISMYSPSPSAINAAVEINPQTHPNRRPYASSGGVSKLSLIGNTVLDVPTSFGYFGVKEMKAFGNTFTADRGFLRTKRPGSAHGWTITGSTFGENSTQCQSDFNHNCSP